MRLPLQISTQYQQYTWPLGSTFKGFVHSLQSQEHWRDSHETHTHKKNTLNHRTKKNYSIKRLRWIYVYVKLTWTVFITPCVWDVKNMPFKSRSFFFFFFYLEKSCRNALFLRHFRHKSLIVVLCAANGNWDVLLNTSRHLAVDCSEWWQMLGKL